ncbi:MAG: PQQ-dependent sugar dehydrogenase [Planctomycetes bacterium]|nr:PQQ-dependent sugar dehydrogenase [Planctomycetota bacterium]
MIVRRAWIAVLALAVPVGAEVQVENAFPNLSFELPVDIQDPMDGTNRLFVVEKIGIVSVFVNDPSTTSKASFLDLTDRVSSGEEEGIIALAFHPDYQDNGYFYITYTIENPSVVCVISRFTVSATDPDSADLDSELILLEVPQPASNHNTHRLGFGPDGYLDISSGDGGCCGDPLETGQDLTDILGSILRIDVDNPADGLNYSIPPDNPFAGNTEGYREEIYAYGFRNPWRFSFDSTGRLWVGDVGQSEWEEIDWVVSGGNYGWNTMEGTHCFDPGSGCDQTDLIMPVWEYAHQFGPDGGFAVIGGHVYEGNGCPMLSGRYIFGDYISRNIWALSFNESGVTGNLTIVPSTGIFITAFGVDHNHELYGASYLGGFLFKLTCCEGDANGDGTVDPLDAGFVLSRFGCPVGTGDANCDAADQNGDGLVDPLDGGFVLARFGECP